MSFFYRHLHLDRFEGIVEFVARRGSNLVDHIQATKDFSEHAVAPVQSAVVRQANEKLRAVVVEIAGACTVPRRLRHGDRAAFVRSVARFWIQPVPRPAGPMPTTVWFLAQRVAALNDEAGYDAVKGRTVIKSHLGELEEVINMARGVFRVKANLDLAELSGDRDTRVDFLEFHRHGDKCTKGKLLAARG